MYYDGYLLSLKANIKAVCKAAKEGVELSRLEHFDFLFKRELAIVEGLRGKKSLAYKLVNNISNFDYRLACFYAKGFSNILKTVENGYTVKGLEKQFKSLVREAVTKYICIKSVKLVVKDLNGTFSISLFENNIERTYSIKNINEYVLVAFEIISFLGSVDEDNMGYREWFNTYLLKEYNRVVTGVDAEAFIEVNKVAKDFKTYVKDEVKAKSKLLSNGKVIHLVNK